MRKRQILLHEAVFITAQQIVRQRKGAESKHAQRLLDFISAERLLQIAMLADAMDESLMHIRFCDAEDVDNARLPFENQRFLTRIVFLFGPQEKCFQTGSLPRLRFGLIRPRLIAITFEPIATDRDRSYSGSVC